MYLDTPKGNQDIDILVGNQTGLFKTDDKPASHKRFSKLKSPKKSEEDLFANAWILMYSDPVEGNIHWIDFRIVVAT